MRRPDGMHVAGKMQVDVFHRHDLRMTAAGRPAFHAETRTERRFADADHGVLADPVQPVAEPDGRRRLAFAGGGRGDRGNEDQLAARPVCEIVQKAVIDLGLVRAILMQGVGRDIELCADIGNGKKLRGARDFNIGALVGHDGYPLQGKQHRS